MHIYTIAPDSRKVERMLELTDCSSQGLILQLWATAMAKLSPVSF